MSFLQDPVTAFKKLRYGERREPSEMLIPPSQVKWTKDPVPPDDLIGEPLQVGEPFVTDRHYFQVFINEMYLTHGRDFWEKVDPMVIVQTEFDYNGKPRQMPFIVGRDLFKFSNVELDDAKTLIKDVDVTDEQPYKGGDVTLTMMLLQDPYDDYARKLVSALSDISKVLTVTAATETYIAIANTVLAGIEGILGLGERKAIIALQRTFSAALGQSFARNYFAFIDKPNVNAQALRVVDNRLMIVNAAGTMSPYREANYVLYTIAAPPNNRRVATRLDVIQSQVKLIDFEASRVRKQKDEHWRRTQYMMGTFNLALLHSPDLTRAQADKLQDEYALRFTRIMEKAIKGVAQGENRQTPTHEAELSDQAFAGLLD